MEINGTFSGKRSFQLCYLRLVISIWFVICYIWNRYSPIAEAIIINGCYEFASATVAFHEGIHSAFPDAIVRNCSYQRYLFGDYLVVLFGANAYI